MSRQSANSLKNTVMSRLTAPKIAEWLGSPLLIWAIIGFGILVRLIQYLRNPSLWVDEAALASSIVNNSASNLVGYLDKTHTAAPIGFLILEKLAVELLGNSEYSLRLLPLIAGIASLLLMYPVAKHYISSWAVPVAVALFATSTSLVWFSTQVKQYSLDVFMALLVLLVAGQVMKQEYAWKWLIIYGVVGILTIWFSFPIVFVLAGTGIVLGGQVLQQRNWTKVIQLSLVGAGWLISFGASYLGQSGNELISDGIIKVIAGQSGFVPLPPRSLADVRWLFDMSFGLLSIPGGMALTGIAMLSLLLGCAGLWTTGRVRLLLLISPVIVTALVSSVQLYPFMERWVLFLVPMVLLLVAEGASVVFAKTRNTYPAIGIVLVALLLLHPVSSEAFRLVESRGSEEVRAVLQYYEAHRLEGDKLYVYPGAYKAFTYYADRFQLDETEYVIAARDTFEVSGDRDLNVFIDEMDQLRGNSRVWFLFSNVRSPGFGVKTDGGIDEEVFHIFYLDNIGERVDQFRMRKAVVYLYDLSQIGDSPGFSIRP